MKRVYSNENGGLLIVLLLLFVLLMGIIIALTGFLWAQHEALQNSETATKAFYFAQSGLADCLANPTIHAIDTTNVGEGQFVVTVQSLGSGGKYWIRSTGMYRQKKRTLSVLIVKRKKSGIKILDWQDSYIKQVID
ncbi:MAG: hypothetical protein GXO76_14590 [Calditrichaeota bacterium]|nr:hypothetical protein [Calditrichota bacterium]